MSITLIARCTLFMLLGLLWLALLFGVALGTWLLVRAVSSLAVQYGAGLMR